MSYVDAIWDREKDIIHAVERDPKKGRLYQTFPARYLFYYPDARGKYKSIHGENLSKVSAKSWKEFIKEHQLNQHYIHVNLEGNNDIRKAYDAFSNPLFYLINSDGKFVGKKLSPNTLRKIIIADIQSVKN